MSYGKKSLFITRFLCLAGLPAIWCIAIINIAFQYINTKKTIALGDSVGPNLKFKLNSLLSDDQSIGSQKIRLKTLRI